MKAFEISSPGAIDNLQLVERPLPQPGPRQVLIKVKAASLNYRDLGVIKRGMPGRSGAMVPLSDGAGEVTAVGAGVSRVKVGERVAGIFNQNWIGGEAPAVSAVLGGALDGMLTEFIVLDEDGVVPIPEHLSFEEAATLPCAGVTAWHALITLGKLKAGDTVLVEGTGGVSIFALQFAHMHGARVIATSSSDDKLKRAIALGAAAGINYRNDADWDRRARELTGGRGIDHIVDIGGVGTFVKAVSAARTDGIISLVGVITGLSGEIDLAPILRKRLHVNGINVGSREMFEAMNRAIGSNHMRPVVDRVFPFEQAREAFRLLEAGAHFGKVVIRIG